MGTASIMLKDGTPVVVTFTDDGDGKVEAAEINDAQKKLGEKLNSEYKFSGELLIGSQMRLIESGQDANTRPTSVSAGAFANNNNIRLFGSPKSFSKSAPEGSQDWVATATHGKDIYYREMGHWDAAQGREVQGRGLHVSPETGQILEVEVSVFEGDYEERVWKPLDKLSAEEKEGLPIGTLPTETVAWHEPEVTPQSWTFAVQKGDYYYFQGPGDQMARRSIVNPKNVQIMQTLDAEEGGGKVWRAAEEGEKVPEIVTVGEGSGMRAFSVVQTDVMTEKGTGPDGQEKEDVYYVYNGVELPSGQPAVLRRNVLDKDGVWDVGRNEPAGSQEPVAGQGAKKGHHQGRRGGHRAHRHKKPQPAVGAIIVRN